MDGQEIRERSNSHRVRDSVMIMAALVIIIAGARMAANLLVPFLLALFIAVICGSPINALIRRGLPAWLASTLVGLAVALFLFFTVVLLGATAEDFIEALPGYQQQFQVLLDRCTVWLAERGVDVSREGLSGVVDPAATVGFFGGFLSGLGDTLSNMALILFTVIFLLADAPSFPRKLAMNDTGRARASLAALQELASSMNGYIATKALVSLLTGFLIWLGLALMGVEFAVLWGFLAFLLNFVPNIGSALAAIPAVLLSLLDGDPLKTSMIIALYLAINTVVGNVIEPRVMGQRVGLSTLAVFVSLIFWGWMFGAVGMLLSVPLTMVIKFVTQQHPGTAWFAVLVSNLPEETPQAEDSANE
jgi:AI-2 transport protein TqsA